MLRRTMLAGLLIGSLSLAAYVAPAQDYPTRAITIIVPGSPGGAIDTVARLVGQRLSEPGASRSWSTTRPVPPT